MLKTFVHPPQTSFSLDLLEVDVMRRPSVPMPAGAEEVAVAFRWMRPLGDSALAQGLKGAVERKKGVPETQRVGIARLLSLRVSE